MSLIQSLAWELLYVEGVAIRKKKKKKDEGEEKENGSNSNDGYYLLLIISLQAQCSSHQNKDSVTQRG